MFKSNFSNRDLLLEETNRDLDKIKEKITNIESSKEDLNQESFEEFKIKDSIYLNGTSWKIL